MLSQPTRIATGTSPAPYSSTMLPRVSARTFLHCLTALIVNTKILAGNVISLHLHIAGDTGVQEDTCTLLSRFHLELEGQALALQHRVAFFSNIPWQSPVWRGYANLWRIANVDDLPATLLQLRDATDLLTALYETMLPVAATQPDQSASFYLLAEHLVVLNKFYFVLKKARNQEGQLRIKSNIDPPDESNRI